MLKKGLSIDTTFNPHQFSSDSTFKTCTYSKCARKPSYRNTVGPSCRLTPSCKALLCYIPCYSLSSYNLSSYNLLSNYLSFYNIFYYNLSSYTDGLSQKCSTVLYTGAGLLLIPLLAKRVLKMTVQVQHYRGLTIIGTWYSQCRESRHLLYSLTGSVQQLGHTQLLLAGRAVFSWFFSAPPPHPAGYSLGDACRRWTAQFLMLYLVASTPPVTTTYPSLLP